MHGSEGAWGWQQPPATRYRVNGSRFPRGLLARQVSSTLAVGAEHEQGKNTPLRICRLKLFSLQFSIFFNKNYQYPNTHP